MRLAISSALLLLAAACGSGRSAPLSLSARSTAALTAADPAKPGLQRVRIALRKIELTPAAATDAGEVENDHGAGDAGDEHGAGEVEVAAGPFLVELAGAALGGSVTHVLDAQVPAGTYREVKLEVRPVEAGATGALADLAAKNASIIIDGTIDGQAFSFVSGLRAAQKKEGIFTVESGASSNITLQLDPSGWFVSSSGAQLDPRLDSARAAIEANLAKSIDLFQDDDRSGHENHHRGDHDADGGSDHGGGGHDDGGHDDGGHDDGGHDGGNPDGGHSDGGR